MGEQVAARFIKKILDLPVIRKLKRFSFLMTDKTVKIKENRCEPQELRSFGHGITCQCMKKQSCLDKQACHTQSFFKRSHLYVP